MKNLELRVGKKIFSNWKDALAHAKALLADGKMSKQDFNAIKLQSHAASGDMDAYVKMRNSGDETKDTEEAEDIR